jgi:hypothetical protein
VAILRIDLLLPLLVATTVITFVCREALLVATPEDIINIADILGVTFQDNCVATALKAWTN